MANIKSAKKRVLIAEANHQKNIAFKSTIKTAVKKTLELAATDDKDALTASLSANGLNAQRRTPLSKDSASLTAASFVVNAFEYI